MAAQANPDELQYQQWASQYDPQGSIPDEQLRQIYQQGLSPGGESGHWADPPAQRTQPMDEQYLPPYTPPMAEAQGQQMDPTMDPNDPGYAFQGPRPYVPPEVSPFGRYSAMNPLSKPAHPLLSFITDLVQSAGRIQHSPTWGVGEALGAVEQAGEKRRIERLKGPAAEGYNAPMDEPIPEGLSPDEKQIWLSSHELKKSYVARQQMINQRLRSAQQAQALAAQREYDKEVEDVGTKLANAHFSSIPGIKLYPDDAVPFSESRRGVALRGVQAREAGVGLSQDRMRLQAQALEDRRKAEVERQSQQAARDAAQQEYRAAQFGQGERRLGLQERGLGLTERRTAVAEGGLVERKRSALERESETAARDTARETRANQAHLDRMASHRTNAASGYSTLHGILKDVLKDQLAEYKRLNPGAESGTPPQTPQAKELLNKIQQTRASMDTLVNESAKALGVPFDKFSTTTKRENTILQEGELDVGGDEPSGGR